MLSTLRPTDFHCLAECTCCVQLPASLDWAGSLTACCQVVLARVENCSLPDVVRLSDTHPSQKVGWWEFHYLKGHVFPVPPADMNQCPRTQDKKVSCVPNWKERLAELLLGTITTPKNSLANMAGNTWIQNLRSSHGLTGVSIRQELLDKCSFLIWVCHLQNCDNGPFLLYGVVVMLSDAECCSWVVEYCSNGI